MYINDCASNKIKPDGFNLPSWSKNPISTLELSGHIGLQGRHAGASIYFKNI